MFLMLGFIFFLGFLAFSCVVVGARAVRKWYE